MTRLFASLFTIGLIGCASAPEPVPAPVPPAETVAALPEPLELSPDAVAALLPEVEARDFIAGRLLCHASLTDREPTPCYDVGLVLSDEQGNTISRIYTTDGEFIFHATRANRYRLRTDTPRHILLTDRLVSRGENLIVHVVQQ